MNSRYRIGQLWEATYNNSPIGIAVLSPLGQFSLANLSFCALVGYEETELVSCRWVDISKNILDLLFLFNQLFIGNIPSFQTNHVFIHKHGFEIPVKMSAVAVRNADDSFQYFLIHCLHASKVLILDGNLRNEIQNGLAHREFKLYWQPIKDLVTLSTVGYEGLARWHHPTKGILYPDKFITACESDIFLQSQFCQYVFLEALKIQSVTPYWLSINISPPSLLSNSFKHTIAELSRVSDQPKIYFELTEREPLDADALAFLAAHGYGVFIDDFGQAHSGIIQILQILDSINHENVTIKFDGWFSAQSYKSHVKHFLKHFIQTCHTQNIKCIAENIETHDHLLFWQSVNCDYGQGWYFAKAEPDIA